MGPAKESSGMGTTVVLSITKFIHGEAKGEVNGQFWAPSVYLNDFFVCFYFQATLQLI